MQSYKNILGSGSKLGIYPAVLARFEEARGLYGSYYKFYFQVSLENSQKVMAEYKTSTVFSSSSPRGSSAFYQLVARLLSESMFIRFEKLRDLNILVGRPCMALLEQNYMTRDYIITKIFSQSNYP